VGKEDVDVPKRLGRDTQTPPLLACNQTLAGLTELLTPRLRILIVGRQKNRMPPHAHSRIPHLTRLSAIATAVLALGLLAGCFDEPRTEGTFERNLTVNGPVHLELACGSGDVHVTAGNSSEVHIRGTAYIHDWSSSGRERTLETIKSNPPISQEGNLIKVGQLGGSFRHSSIDYTIEIPADSEIRSTASSGDVEVVGIKGPAIFTSGSGNVTARNIANDVQIRTGSGDLKLEQINGQIQATTGSGDVVIHSVKGAVRLGTGSGDVEISHPADNVIADTGSGDVEVNDATADLRLHTSSGSIKISGNPNSTNFWDIRASSGDVNLNVPQSSSFRLYAHTGSGEINPKIPFVMEGTVANHELRARVGDGKARVEIETSSGTIELD
jgi:hypothetical protein